MMKPLTILCLFTMTLTAQAADFVIALKPDKNPDQMLTERKALADELSKALGKTVEVIVPLSSAVLIEGLANGSIDAGYLSATDLVHARKAGAASLLLAGEINGRREYASYWVTLRDKPYKTIEDLKGKPVAFASRTSTSGYLIPMLDLNQKGLIKKHAEEFFGEENVWYGTGYASAVERVLSGEAEAAAVSDYVLDKDKHLSEAQRGQLRVLAAQGPVPTHVIAVASKLDPDRRKALQAALLGLEQSAPQLRDAVFTSPLVVTEEDAHLAPVVQALEIVSTP